MELYKIEIGNTRKRFYESKKTFDYNWLYHIRSWSKWYDVTAYKIDCKNECWKLIMEYKAKGK